MLRLLFRAVLALLLLAVAAAGWLAWRIGQGPISLAALQPVIQRVVDRSSPYAVSFRDPTLVWLRDETAVGLAARDLELRTRDGKFVAGAPAASAVLAFWPLLEGSVEPEVLHLELPRLELTRAADGRLVLGFAGQLAALPLGEGKEGAGFAALLGEDGATPDPRLGRLREVRVTAPALVYLDAASGGSTTASDARFELKQADGTWSAALAARLDEGKVLITARPVDGGRKESFAVEVDRFPLQALLALLPQLPKVKLALPVTGKIAFALDLGSLVPGVATVSLATRSGSVGSTALGLPPTAIDTAQLDAALEPGWRAGRIERLRLAGPGYSVSIAGRVARAADGGAEADLALTADDLDAREVLNLWPETVGKAARAWVAENVRAGRILGGTFHLGQDSPRPGQPDLAATFDFAEAEVRYLDTFPPATGVAGRGSFAGDLLAFELKQGQVGRVEATAGDVSVSSVLSESVSQLKVRLDLRSSVPAAMAVLDSEPVRLAKATGLSADGAAGQQTTRLDLSLPLLATIPPDRVRYKAVTRVAGLQLKDVRPGYDLAAPSVRLTVTQAGLDAAGEVRVNGVPMTVAWRENFQPVKGVQRTVDLKGRADAAAVRALRFDWPAPLWGSVGVAVKLVEARKPLRTVDLALDLRETAFRLPGLLISKRAGQDGSVAARLVQNDPATLAVEQLAVDAGSLQAQGTVGLRLDPLRPERLRLVSARTMLGDLSADLTLDRDVWRGRVDVGRLDLRPLRAAQGEGEAKGGLEIPDLAVEVAARSLRLGDAPLTGVAGSVDRRRGVWRSANLRASVEDSEVALDLRTQQASALTLRGSDAGWLIRAFATSDNGVRGGTFRLSADLAQEPGATTGSGELKIRDFTLWGAPTVARIVSLASFSGLANALSGRGVPVSRLVVPFRLDGPVLTVEQARLVAADIGARADGTANLDTGALAITGTVAPAYTVNRILGRIPIIGRILSGSGSDAALAATFSVDNTLADPRVSVNPLAVLVPGMIRDLFAALTADAAEAGTVDQR